MKVKSLFLLTAIVSIVQPSMSMQLGQVAQNAECPICLEDFCTGEPIFNLPYCSHRIHAMCNHDLIDCPFCRKVAVSRDELRARMEEAILSIGLVEGAEDDFARALRCQEDEKVLVDPSGIITRGRISSTLLLDAINNPNSPLLYNIEELIFRLDSNDLMVGGRAALRKADAQMLLMISTELNKRGVSLAELIILAQKYSETDLVSALQEINVRS